MINVYEVDGGPMGVYWDVYDADDEFVRSIKPEYLEEHLDNYRAGAFDFCLHTLAEYEEYHLALGRS